MSTAAMHGNNIPNFTMQVKPPPQQMQFAHELYDKARTRINSIAAAAPIPQHPIWTA